MKNIYKECDFNTYCPTCKYSEQEENEEPCDACLEETVNINSHKPVKWEEDE